MKSVKLLFNEAIDRVVTRGFDTLYVAIDVHGTIILPSAHTEMRNDTTHGFHECVVERNQVKFVFYNNAIKALNILSQNPNIKIILWTSTQNVSELMDFLKCSGVLVDYLNQNPDFQFNSYADFSKKFCFDVLLDDKAGFDPVNDWGEILEVDFSKLGGTSGEEGKRN